MLGIRYLYHSLAVEVERGQSYIGKVASRRWLSMSYSYRTIPPNGSLSHLLGGI